MALKKQIPIDNNKTAQNEVKSIDKKSVLPSWFFSFGFVRMVVLFNVRFVAIPVSNSVLGPSWGGALCLMLAAVVPLFVAVARKPSWPNAREMCFSMIYGFFSVASP